MDLFVVVNMWILVIFPNFPLIPTNISNCYHKLLSSYKELTKFHHPQKLTMIDIILWISDIRYFLLAMFDKYTQIDSDLGILKSNNGDILFFRLWKLFQSKSLKVTIGYVFPNIAENINMKFSQLCSSSISLNCENLKRQI